MAQFHFLDDSGDPGSPFVPGASTHFDLVLVQLPQRTSLPTFEALRKVFHLPNGFEFKYYRTRERQKAAFFEATQTIPFRVRIAFVDKRQLGNRWLTLSGQEVAVALLTSLILRIPELDLANDTLIIDGATPAFRRALRVRLSHECASLGRTRPFSKIVGADSAREDGLQLADMVAGATREYVTTGAARYYRTFGNKVVDVWNATSMEFGT